MNGSRKETRTHPTPTRFTDNLNDLPNRRFDILQRPQMSITPINGTWWTRHSGDGIPPFHDGTYLLGKGAATALRVAFTRPCTSVRFGYGAAGPGSNGSCMFIDLFDEQGNFIGEQAYRLALKGLPGLWVDLHAEDFGQRIGAMVVRKDNAEAVTAQIDNFTMTQ